MTDFNRRHVIAALGAGVLAPLLPCFAADSSDDIGLRLAQVREAGRLSGLHTLLVSQASRLVYEYYGTGPDEAWGPSLGVVTFSPTVLHDIRSVSKSVVSLLYGIALAAGQVPPPEAKLYDQFPEYADLASQPGRDRLTIHHLLSMTAGFEWDELTYPYGDPRNSENAMIEAPDHFRYVLERPIVNEPGTKWRYCGGATALLGHLIARGTGQPLLDYARQVLFDPLGFGPAEWVKDEGGEPYAASGLRLLPRDMLKLGQLVLAGGSWSAKQIVSADWVKRATTPIVEIARGRNYGYHWYIGDVLAGAPHRPLRWIGGVGWGGQQLMAFPELDLAVAVNCGNYHKTGPEQGMVVRAAVVDVVLPGFA
jgi:CubicO group peptidase (beta-lactamase class C family)